jgi:hypothetical protein
MTLRQIAIILSLSLCLLGCSDERDQPVVLHPVDPNDPTGGKTIIIRPDGTMFTIDRDGRNLQPYFGPRPELAIDFKLPVVVSENDI